MEKKQYAPIYDKLLPIYKQVATPTWRGNEGDHKVAIGTSAGEGRWERNAVGNEGVLVLDEYRKSGRDFEPRFSYKVEQHGVRCDHSDTSFLMVLQSAKNKFAEVTGMTFRDWLEANGQSVEHLFDNTKTEIRVANNYREQTAEEVAAREARFNKASNEDRSGWRDQSLFGEDEAPEIKATRKSRKARDEALQASFRETKAAEQASAATEKTNKKPAKRKPASAKPSEYHPAEQMDLLF